MQLTYNVLSSDSCRPTGPSVKKKKKVILMYSMFKTEDIDGRADRGCAN